MKISHTIQQKLINLRIIDLEDYYTMSIDNYDIRFQGVYKKNKIEKLKKKGFKFILKKYIESEKRIIQGITIEITLTD